MQSLIDSIRNLIYQVAEEDSRIGKIIESLKWNQITFSTVSPKSGTPIRVNLFDTNNLGVFVSCQTSLIEHLRIEFEDALMFSGNRAILIPLDLFEKDHVLYCIREALTYHLK